jgi:serine/threonine protein kinase
MIYGVPPFSNENPERLFELIELSGVKFPKGNVSHYAIDIIKRLLDKDPTTRLGAKGGINEIGLHPFFSTIDFDLILQKKVMINTNL